jgi:hypothetical protein
MNKTWKELEHKQLGDYYDILGLGHFTTAA